LNNIDPLDRFRIKGNIDKLTLLFEQDTPLYIDEVSDLLGVDFETIDRLRETNKLLGVNINDYCYIYPSWQFQNNNIITGLDLVLNELKEYSNWTKLMFFLTGDVRLNNSTPLEILKSGDIQSVVWSASCYGKQISA
jgi:hypothetical protein